VPEPRGVVLALVTSGEGQDLAPLARSAREAGIDHFQVREKHLSDRDLLARARGAVEAGGGGAMKVIVNGRPDVAALARAHGVQLPEAGLPVAAVRAAFPALIVGASRHSLPGARRAEEEGAHFVALGPIFPTPGKEERALGLQVLREVCSLLAVPVFAIGGIDASSGPMAIAAGASGLMAIRFFTEGSLTQAVADLRP